MSRLSTPHRANKLVSLLEDVAEFSRVNLPRADYLAEESPIDLLGALRVQNSHLKRGDPRTAATVVKTASAYDLRGRQTEFRGGTCFSLECAFWRRRGSRYRCAVARQSKAQIWAALPRNSTPVFTPLYCPCYLPRNLSCNAASLLRHPNAERQAHCKRCSRLAVSSKARRGGTRPAKRRRSGWSTSATRRRSARRCRTATRQTFSAFA